MASAARLCFVIMPFAETHSCSEEEWTEIFETLLKPAVEGDPDLGYECRRSVATRGNLVKGILQDLQAAHVVIADLTDRNANVFYELGVRHTLTDRSIIIAQRRTDIPFDLQGYANHEYDWQTEEGREALTGAIRGLLRDVDSEPAREDNPVSDFLRSGGNSEEAGAIADLADLQRRVTELEEEVGGHGWSGFGRAPRPSSEIRSLLDDPPDNLTWAEMAKRLSHG